MTKVADGLIDPKLVLSWLLNALGAPAVLVGAAGADARGRGAAAADAAGRTGCSAWRSAQMGLGRGLARGRGSRAARIALAALLLEGWVAGVHHLRRAGGAGGLPRALCSVSYKDILGKTVAKTRRGSVTGVAGSVSSAAVHRLRAAADVGLLQDVAPLVVAVGAGRRRSGWPRRACSRRSRKSASEPEERRRAATLPRCARTRSSAASSPCAALLTATALAPPYIVILSGGDGALQRLGALVLASAAPPS